MKRAPVLLILAAVAFAASAGTFAWLMGRYLPGYPAAAMFMDASVIAKLAIMLAQMLTFLALVLGVIGLFVRSAATIFRLLLMLIAAASAGLGLLAALYGWMNIQAAIRAVGPVSFEVTAPGYAETLLALSVGLFGALVALGFHALLGRRA
ncbi:MAG: hypothetical protein KKC29_05050 [Alphaproteobacteria bacterium]|jgi:hypothetical protein|nr:hypothetical protein [Alphaproteobacteria bacterium]MBU2041458.1 hypothetical protein [Alphaproteobacteria bacterium]MBU2125936.1 hypothetical protein [Alphaproteobacteria bacterium]MBU2208542.1 hypothetical protein [Alphaproteobacteria bacterium]MBU2290447.1 hypothetical protein [Alphaproteobacteria bacterium]